MSVKIFFLTWILHRQIPHYHFGMCCRFLSHFFFVYYSPTYEFPHFHNSLTTLPRKWSLRYGADWISRASFSPAFQPLGCPIQSYFSDQWTEQKSHSRQDLWSFCPRACCAAHLGRHVGSQITADRSTTKIMAKTGFESFELLYPDLEIVVDPGNVVPRKFFGC